MDTVVEETRQEARSRESLPGEAPGLSTSKGQAGADVGGRDGAWVRQRGQKKHRRLRRGSRR